ncbi:MAG: TRAP transporter small permease, partial [Kofleriaceae bacterium]|nr:TRAP transporter small permease [Kofleriaceae bacterium]
VGASPYHRLVSDEPEDEGSPGAGDAKGKSASTKAPATAASAGEPPVRTSSLDLHAPLTYPDDGPFAKRVRSVDNYIGKGEQIVLVAILAAVVFMGAGHALLEKLAHVHIPYKDDIMRAGTFALAMLGGAFATHQMKNLSMDLLSRRFSARNRLVLRVVLTLFVIFTLILTIRSGMHNIAKEAEFQQRGEYLFSRVQVAWLLPISMSLVIVHSILHIILDVDYLRRGKVPPERMRSGH